MSQFTMTGKSGNKNATKEKFKKYVNVIHILWRVARAADESYTKAQFEHDLTYKVIKYAYKFRFVNLLRFIPKNKLEEVLSSISIFINKAHLNQTKKIKRTWNLRMELQMNILKY